jgi:acetylornithine deacetylase/succinyl-diaminopimelate desuccinylase-like protein
MLACIWGGERYAWGSTTIVGLLAAALPDGARVLAEAGARPADARAAAEFHTRTTADASLDVHWVAGGERRTIVPPVARAALSVRLAPGQRSDEIAAALEELLREAAPQGAELELTRLSSSPPGLIPPDAPAVQRGLEAFERTFGRRPLLVRSGGTLPIVPALADKGIPTIITGFATPESNIHSPNERLLAEYLPLGIETAKELYRRLAELDA